MVIFFYVFILSSQIIDIMVEKYEVKLMNNSKKSDKVLFIGIGVCFALFALFFIIKGNSSKTVSNQQADITIQKSDITEKAKFIPYQAGNTKMEVVAVKAPDGTIRTAFNTCQVCYNSGRGYYVQQGDELVCQNCGNRFKTSQVEKVKGGCNPVPIMKENKTEDASTITISKDFLVQNKDLFGKWKK